MTHYLYKTLLAPFALITTSIITTIDGSGFSDPPSPYIGMATIDTFENCIHDYYTRLSDAQVLQFRDDNKKEWLKYMPNVGLTYTPSGDPRPGISVGSALIYRSYKDKKAKAETIKSIYLSNQLAADTEALAFRKLVQQLQIMEDDLQHELRTLDIDTELFEFYTKQYESREMTPSNYLLKKRDYFNKKEALRKAEVLIQMHRLEIQEAGRCE